LKASEDIRRYLHILRYQSVSELKQEISKKYLGFLWWLLDPILYMSVFYLIFATGLRGAARGPDFVWFLLCGLVPWKWFSSSMENGSRSITGNASLISQVYFPKIILPTTIFIAQTFKFLIVFSIFLLVLALSGRLDYHNLLLLPGILLLQAALNLSIAALAGAVVPFAPDLKQLISYCTIFLFFLSGIFFDVAQLSDEAAQWLQYNPMLILISWYRHLLLGSPIPDIANIQLVCAEILVFSLATAAMYYRYDRVFPRLVI
jgi:lipopolysaccharide transport system permease protein